MFEEDIMPKFVKVLLSMLGFAFLGLIIGIILSGFVKYNKFSFDFALAGDPITLLLMILGFSSGLLLFLNKKQEKGMGELGAKDKSGKKIDQFFDSRWVTEKELRSEKKYNFNTWTTIRSSKDGMLIRSQVTSNNLLINLFKPIHALVFGTTGTGKTERFVIPMIQVNASTKTKPNFIVTDPKGELYTKNYNKLIQEGYQVKTLNLREPFSSVRWNPLDNSYLKYQEAHRLRERVITRRNINPADLNLKIISNEYNNIWYEFDGVAYPNEEMLNTDLESKKTQLIDQAENELRDIAAIMCPIEDKNSPVWERGAQDFIYGTMLAMLEDSVVPELGMTREKFNFYNLQKICNYKDNDPDNPYKTLRQYFMGRSKFSKVQALTSTAINNAPTTTRSFMGIVGTALKLFNDTGMCYLTSYNEMEFDSFATKPTAFFIIIPDEKESRHGIATMCISQLYNKLVELASGFPDLSLPRTTYFLLDEFANLPKINKIDNMITVSRSRNIFFALVIQSYSQLNAKYGDDIAETLKGNCPIKIFIGTDDAKTCKEFSEQCGTVTLQTTSTSESKQKDETNKSTNVSTTSRPLIYPDELSHLSNVLNTTDYIIVKNLGEFPIKVKSTYAWATPMFNTKKYEAPYTISKSLDEEKVMYSIVERNKKVFRPKPFSLDDL